VPELHLYDFDGTLFRSPDEPSWWGKDNWIFNPASLGPPCVPDTPGADWWNGPVVSSAKQSIADADTWTILCTGRPQGVGNRWRIPELLKQAGLVFDEVFLNPGLDTEDFKKKTITRILRQYPDIDTVQVWEDRGEHLAAFMHHVEGLGKAGVPHLIKGPHHDVVCTPDDMRDAVNEGRARWREATRSLTARWLGRKAGIFKGPPKATEQALEWFLGTYTAAVWFEAQEHLATLHKKKAQHHRRNKGLKRALDKVLQGIHALKDGKVFRWTDGDHKLAVALKVERGQAWDWFGYKADYASEGRRLNLRNPEWSTEDRDQHTAQTTLRNWLIRDVFPSWANGLDWLVKGEDRRILQVQEIITECRKSAGQPEALTTGVVQNTIKPDLSGWPEWDRVLRDTEGAEKIPGERALSLRLVIKDETTDYGGYFSSETNTVAVTVPAPRSLVEDTWVGALTGALKRMRSTVPHELQHFGQYLLTEKGKFKTLTHDDDTGRARPQTVPQIGVPGKGKWTPLTPETPLDPGDNLGWKDTPAHSLREVEFYPDLMSDVGEFEQHVKENVPRPYWRQAFQAWTGAKPELAGKKYRNPNPYQEDTSSKNQRGAPGDIPLVWLPRTSTFFFTLKEHATEKWKKAAKEFLKELESRGWDFPTEDEFYGGGPVIPEAGGEPMGMTILQWYQKRVNEAVKATYPGEQMGWNDPRREELSVQVLSEVKKEYGNFVAKASPKVLYRHRQKVFTGGHGREYYLTPRWEKWTGEGPLPDAPRTPDGDTLIEDHPKVQEYIERAKRVATRWLRRRPTPEAQP